MKKSIILLAGIIFSIQNIYSQIDVEYPFILANSITQPYTMRQSNENFLSLYRFAVRGLNNSLPRKESFYIQSIFLLSCYIGQNTAQQSILSYEGISSTSMPLLFNEKWTPYVKGVKDMDLQRLRDNNLPTYIRLHLAPYEMEYALAIRSNSLMTWEKESPNVLRLEHYVYKLYPFCYYFYSLFDKDNKTEETNELSRDITGNKVLGAIRHLHRPNMEFYRYTNYKDLTDEEEKFVSRVGWRSLLNLIDPTLFFMNGFRLNNGNKINFMLGYNMAPFGDYFDQHFWLMTETLNTHFYLREYENRRTWFPEAGVTFADIKPFDWLGFDTNLHGWMQPQNLDFNTSRSRLGGAIDVTFKFFDYEIIRRRGTYCSLNVGITAKTQGYLLEEMELGNHINVRLGFSIWME